MEQNTKTNNKFETFEDYKNKLVEHVTKFGDYYESIDYLEDNLWNFSDKNLKKLIKNQYPGNRVNEGSLVYFYNKDCYLVFNSFNEIIGKMIITEKQYTKPVEKINGVNKHRTSGTTFISFNNKTFYEINFKK